MKELMLGTALALIAGFGVMAQEAAPETQSGTAAEIAAQDAQMANVPGFRASKFIGMDLYTLAPERVDELRRTDAAPAADMPGAHWSSGPAFVSARDQWEDIGKVDDIVLSQDGNVQGVLLDVGGFLGIGARTVMVSIDDLYFVADSDRAGADEAQSISDFFVVASMSRDQLEVLPEWSDHVLKTGFTVRDHAASAGAVGTTDSLQGDVVQPEQPTVEDLTGASVQDPSGSNIGKVDDLVMEGDQITAAIVDVGGFLGIGAHRVALPIDELHVVRKDDGITVDHVEVSMTKDQLKALPEHE